MLNLPGPQILSLDPSERYRFILKEDLANVLTALMVSENCHPDFYKALTRVAMAFGINVDIMPEQEQTVWAERQYHPHPLLAADDVQTR